MPKRRPIAIPVPIIACPLAGMSLASWAYRSFPAAPCEPLVGFLAAEFILLTRSLCSYACISENLVIRFSSLALASGIPYTELFLSRHHVVHLSLSKVILFFPQSILGVTESTIVAIIHCPDIGYCLFGISLVAHILYRVPCTFLVLIISYWVVLSFARLFTPLAPCTQLGYSTLPTMYYWINTSVAIPSLFDSITCFVSYILSPLYLCSFAF